MSQLASIVKERQDLEVFVLLDNPWSKNMAPAVENFNPLHHVNRFFTEDSQFVISCPSNEVWQEANNKVKMLTVGWATALETASYICPNGFCNLAEWYRDANHLNPRTVAQKAIWIDTIFQVKPQK